MQKSIVGLLVVLLLCSASARDFWEWAKSDAESTMIRRRRRYHDLDELDRRAEEAHTHNMQRRMAKGLKLPGQHLVGSPGHRRQGRNDPDTSINGFNGFVLGFAYGLQHNPRQPGQCYQAIESSVFILDTLGATFTEIYLPENWSQALVSWEDYVHVYASINAHCEWDKFSVGISTFINGEGAAELGARLLGGAIVELPKEFNIILEPSNSDFIKSEAFAKICSLVFRWTID